MWSCVLLSTALCFTSAEGENPYLAIIHVHVQGVFAPKSTSYLLFTQLVISL